MNAKRWVAAVAVIVLFLMYAFRYQTVAWEKGGAVIINRWTGEVYVSAGVKLYRTGNLFGDYREAQPR